MDSRYRNLSIIVTILVVVATAFFLVPEATIPVPEPGPVLGNDFDQGLDNLKDIFDSKGIELFNPGFIADLTSLDTVQLSSINSDLQNFKSNLNSYNSESKAALIEVTDICIDFVDFAKKNQEFDAKLDAVSAVNLSDYCAYTVLFESRDLIGKERMDLLENIDSSISSFNAQYPSQSQASNLDKVTVINIGVELAENQFKMEEATTELKQSCGGI